MTINGTLNTTSGTGISGATIQLQWYSGGMWTNVTGETNNTTSSGTYSISTSGPAVGTYQYQTIYAGSGTTYANATSPVVTVQVVIPTTLTAVANVTTVAANTPFTINGTLSFTSRHRDRRRHHPAPEERQRHVDERRDERDRYERQLLVQ